MLISCSIIILVIIFVLFICISVELKNNYNIGSISTAIFILGGFFGVWYCILMTQVNKKYSHTDTEGKKVIIEINSIDNIQQDTVYVWKGGEQ